MKIKGPYGHFLMPKNRPTASCTLSDLSVVCYRIQLLHKMVISGRYGIKPTRQLKSQSELNQKKDPMIKQIIKKMTDYP